MKKILLAAVFSILMVNGCVDENINRFTALEELPKDYSLDDAKADGCVIFEDGDVTDGENFWDSFVEQSKTGKDAYVRYCHYYTMDDSSGDDSDPSEMYVFDLTYDGDAYTVRWFENDEEIIRKYEYLMKYEDVPESPTATYTSCTRYVLTHDNTVSWDDITHGIYSSQFGDYIDHLSVYNDYVYKEE